ncbi:MAG: ATP synthase F1 subunit delta [Bacteroidales bacterium]|nr:ATP synthase F1 subunit delta [Lentimicrobiaceae bacterium]MDD5695303.1 ATP synthase F1 subunit delta [Bacteroidales bacterium]
MRERKIAYRYAKALFDYAAEEKILDKVNADMELIGKVCSQNRDFRVILKSPIVHKPKKISILRGIFKGHISPETMTYLQIIAKKSRENYIQDIAGDFNALYLEHQNIKTALIRTAVPIDGSLRQKIISLLEKKTKAGVHLTEEVDPALIGGFIIKVGDQQYDTSIQRKLMLLRREFEGNIYIREF